MSSLNPDHGKIRRTLFQTDAFEVVMIDWVSGHSTAAHDHGWSSCSVLIQEGQFQNTLHLGGSVETSTFNVGDVVTTPVGAQHEMRCLTASGKTLHVYSPRLEAALSSASESARQFSSSAESLSSLRKDLQLSGETNVS